MAGRIRISTHTRRESDTYAPAWKIGGTYMGVIVGAGFASGQEVLQFFGLYGIWGLVGLILVTLLFAFTGYAVMFTGRRVGASSHQDVLRQLGGTWLGRLMDLIVTVFLLGAAVTMAAGAGAVFQEQLGLPAVWGTVALVLAAVVTVSGRLRGVVNAISFIAPFLILSVLGVALGTLARQGLPLAGLLRPPPVRPVVSSWLVAAVLYVSYNLVMAVAVLGPMGAAAQSERALMWGAMLGAAGLGIGALAVNLTVVAHFPGAARYELPMLFAAGRLAPAATAVYSVVLLAEVYSTAVGNLYGFAVRLVRPSSRHYILAVLASGAIALAAAQLGFSTLVRTLYPITGVAGLLLLATLAWNWLAPRGAN